MLFSCLVDADFLDTESFFEPDKTTLRGNYPTPEDLLQHFTDFMEKKTAEAKSTHVNRLRANILDDAGIAKAKDKSGILYLVSSHRRGGKTLSSWLLRCIILLRTRKDG